MLNTRQLQTTQGSAAAPAGEATRREAEGEALASLVPPVDIIEDSAGITLYADLPGVTREGLEVRVESGHLFIEGRISVDVPESLKVIHAEVRGGRYRRSFALSSELDAARVEANLKDGVLTLKVPRTEAARPRRIEVKAE